MLWLLSVVVLWELGCACVELDSDEQDALDVVTLATVDVLLQLLLDLRTTDDELD